MLLEPAAQAGMKIPVLDKTDEFNEQEFPHFSVSSACYMNHPIYLKFFQQFENSVGINSCGNCEFFSEFVFFFWK